MASFIPIPPAIAGMMRQPITAPRPSAVVNPQLAGGNLPISPAQAAVLGLGGGQAATGQTPVTTTPTGAPGAAGFAANPMADFLLGRANRPDEITGGTSLFGRLAALGVGTKLTLENERGARESAAKAIEDLGLPEEQKSALRVAVALGADPGAILSTLNAERGRAAESENLGRRIEAEDEQLDKTIGARAEEGRLERAQEAEQFAVNLDVRKDEFGKEFGLAALKHAEDARANRAGESIARDELLIKQATEDRKRIEAELKAEGLDLSETEGKTMSLLTQASVNDAVISQNPSYADGTVLQGDGVRTVLEQIAQSGSDTVAGFASRYLRGKAYQALTDAERDYLTNGINLAEMATRDLTGAAMRPDELLTRWVSLLPLVPNEGAATIASKTANREATLESMINKLPPAAVRKLAGG